MQMLTGVQWSEDTVGMEFTACSIQHLTYFIMLKTKQWGVMKAGNTFTIEPMINLGSFADDQWPDDWTAVTQDGKASAQFEQTLLVTETGVEVLTERLTKRPWFYDQIEQVYGGTLADTGYKQTQQKNK